MISAHETEKKMFSMQIEILGLACQSIFDNLRAHAFGS